MVLDPSVDVIRAALFSLFKELNDLRLGVQAQHVAVGIAT